MDKLFCPKLPQQYKDKSLTGVIDLVTRPELLAKENEEVDRASMKELKHELLDMVNKESMWYGWTDNLTMQEEDRASKKGHTQYTLSHRPEHSGDDQHHHHRHEERDQPLQPGEDGVHRDGAQSRAASQGPAHHGRHYHRQRQGGRDQ